MNARSSFFTGTANFNAQHGCLKCETIGVWSTRVHCNIFPKSICARRTDAAFRERAYGDHHQVYKTRVNGKLQFAPVVSPLLKLPIDIINDIIVADSLHLLHLGIMKNLLRIYKSGHDGCDFVKWSIANVEQMSSILNNLKLPIEIHRASRGLDVLTHWKASECAVFLNYVGIALLKYFLVEHHYEKFLRLFIATTICSSNYFKRFLPVALQLFKDFISSYYSEFNSVTSNTHNLIHVVDECERFGPLPSMSSYPFENHLFKIKNLLRSGRLPLPQVINRLTEMSFVESASMRSVADFPNYKYPNKKKPFQFSHVELREGFVLNTKFENKWFLTRNGEIVAMNCVDSSGINDSKLKKIGDFFNAPIKSSKINVFQTTNTAENNFEGNKTYQINDILCKLVATTIFSQTVFVPLHHSYPDDEQL